MRWSGRAFTARTIRYRKDHASTQDALVPLSGCLDPGSQTASNSCFRVLCEEIERC
ncbi:hypothetical protein T4A_3794, partial [Trichinella pseudospiralis]